MIRRSVWRSWMTNEPAGAASRGEISLPLGRTMRIGACPITRLSFWSRKFSRDDELSERSVMEPASKLRWAQCQKGNAQAKGAAACPGASYPPCLQYHIK